MSTTEEYNAALLELAEASHAFEPYAEVLKRLKAQKAGNGQPPAPIEPKSLPDADKMRTAGKRMVTALSEASKIYRELPSEVRDQVKAELAKKKAAK